MSPYIRKLPDGYKASESAKQLALQLGYGLDDGYTIVKPFEKHVLRIQKVWKIAIFKNKNNKQRETLRWILNMWFE